ncbi:MAG: hypothetical protein IJ711_08060 [Lachnospiraceae bacterium]|nr:hypothetical protein [Lachnospiraceae bacterium]
MKKVEYSQIVRRKLRALKLRLTKEFGKNVSTKSLKQITDAVRRLEYFEEQGVLISSMYDIDCDYRYLYVGHNYLFYRIEENKIIIAEMFDDREDFIYKLFGISAISQESLDYWGE